MFEVSGVEELIRHILTDYIKPHDHEPHQYRNVRPPVSGPRLGKLWKIFGNVEQIY